MGALGVGAATATGYLIGTIPSADLASRLATRGEIDLREAGSGNPGGLNAAQILGRKWGIAVMAADTVKGALAGFVGRRLGGDSGAYAAAAAAIGGHIWPAWNGFRGGKGVATSGGAVFAVFPPYFLPDAAVAALSASGSRDPERTVQISSLCWVAAASVWAARGWPNAWGPKADWRLVAFSVASAGMILAKFRASRSATA